ncbi:hypothetical protein WG922_15890 [Ramlibacter sp. AN1015]|uniref:hypothetical protein n=1 Tax=Ramlibacter sp. AN1015 TaxID=3133428 RepID=UPI0030C05D7E
MQTIQLAALAAVLVLACVHVFSNRLRVFQNVPRHKFLSAAGGAAVAFVVLQLLPGISKGQETLVQASEGGIFWFLDRHAYLLMLASVLLFYGLEKAARTSRSSRKEQSESDRPGPAVFWLHMATFGVMNVLVGYLMIHRHETIQALVLFFLAMLVKFLINDNSLHAAHKAGYDRLGRWLLAGAVVVGWGTGYVYTVPNVGPAVLQALLAGAVLLNVFKEELPSEKKGKLLPFALGAVAYAGLLVTL